MSETIIQIPPIEYRAMTQVLNGLVFHKQYPASDYRCFIKTEGKYLKYTLEYLTHHNIEYQVHEQLPPIRQD